MQAKRPEGEIAEWLPQMTSGPSGRMNRMNATLQRVQVNILGSSGATVGLPMFIPSNQSWQGEQGTHVSLPKAFYMNIYVPSIGAAREVR